MEGVSLFKVSGACGAMVFLHVLSLFACGAYGFVLCLTSLKFHGSWFRGAVLRPFDNFIMLFVKCFHMF